MASLTASVVLTESQASCLVALRSGKISKTRIAIAAKLDLVKTADALGKLLEFGLIVRADARQWQLTRRGRACCYETIPDRRRRGGNKLGPAAQRFLAALDSPRHASELAERVGVSRQRVHQLAVKLYARGAIRFADDGGRFDIIAHSDDPTELLSRGEERLLSVLSDAYATCVAKMRSAAGISEEQTENILARLLAAGLIEEITGLRGVPLYAITSAGLTHPQYNVAARRAEPPNLPVRSDRVLAVLSTMSDEGQVRIKDVSHWLGIPHQSTNALFQYLKRKSLIGKIGQEQYAPYALTDEGRDALAEMLRRRAA